MAGKLKDRVAIAPGAAHGIGEQTLVVDGGFVMLG